MGRKNGIFLKVNRRELQILQKKAVRRNGITIPKALETVFQQMRIVANRESTIDSYNYIFNQFVQFFN